MAGSICLKYPLCVEWTTELPLDNESCRSPNISLWGSFWLLQLNFNSNTGEYILFLRHSKSNSMSLHKTMYVTTFVQETSDTGEPILHQVRSFNRSYDYLWSITKKKIVGQIPDILRIRKLTISCLFHSAETHLEKTASSTQNTAHLQTLSNDFSTFLKDEIFPDVKLICGDRTFSAHRSVLAARSEVFAAMFFSKMAEAEDGELHIKDMDPEVLELLLKYVYSGEISDLSESTARRVYEAADQYAIHSLGDACSDWMVEHQTLENCLELLVLADEHSDKKFLEVVVSFVAEHLSSLSVENWSTFKKRYPPLVVIVLEKRLADSLPSVAKHWKG